jgi:aminoglycoside phosphotransferase (APT) family kinase protein
MTSEQARQLMQAGAGEGDWTVEPFGAGKFSEVFLARGRGEQFVLRVAPPDSVRQLFYERRMMRQEPALHRRLRAASDVPVPPIVHHDFSRSLIDRDWLIMPRLPGRPLGEAQLSPTARDHALRQWGRHVAAVHELTDPQQRFGYLGEHDCMTPQSNWPEAFREMYRLELADIVDAGAYDQATADDALALLDEHLDVFAACDTPRLCHGDLWVTNLLVEPDGAVTGVIDWDRACWGDLEWDLAIAEYCGVTRPTFWEGYGRRVETHAGPAGIRRLFYLLYEHQKYIVISISSRRNDPAGARRYARESLAAMDRFRRTGRPEF